METLSTVVTEIIICLVAAWILGFLAAWILFRKVQDEYENEIEELEENLSYLTASNNNKERELTVQNLKIKKLMEEKDMKPKSLNLKQEESSLEEVSVVQDETPTVKEDLLDVIDANLFASKK